MPLTETFEFLDIELPPDGDLQLILAERVPAEKSAWWVPAYARRHGITAQEFLECRELLPAERPKF